LDFFTRLADLPDILLDDFDMFWLRALV